MINHKEIYLKAIFYLPIIYLSIITPFTKDKRKLSF